MKNIIVVSCLALSLYASDDYTPLSQLSDNKKEEYNFVKKSDLEKPLETDIYKRESPKTNEIIEPLEEVEIKETKVDILQDVEKTQEVKRNTKIENKAFVKEYKNENILKDEVKYSDNSFSKDFSVTPKLSYLYATSIIKGEDIEKTHDLIPTVSFVFKEHTLKAEYYDISAKKDYLNILNANNFELNTKWLKIAYLYKFYNVNFGLAYNDFKIKGNYIENGKDKEEFPTIELHIKNIENHFLVEYGGFYGKNDNDISSAYQYYLNLGYRVFNNDDLIFNLGYIGTTVGYDGYKTRTNGPTLGISSTF
jgi:hypothetical protein